jgi:tRNA (cmo5U34)-methyltransferase
MQHGNALALLDEHIPSDVTLVGFDNAEEMLDKARVKLGERDMRHPYELRHADLHEDISLKDASVVVLLLTLQFVRPLYRHRLIRRIYESLDERGCLILVEKVTVEESHLNRLFIQHYYDMKRRNGYSEMEIARKREAWKMC